MATNSSVNLKITNNADGYDIAGGTTPRKATYTGSDIIFTGSGANVYTFPASTSTLASLTLSETFTNKTLTSPVLSSNVAASAGALEYDGLAPYFTPVSGARGVLPSTMYSIIASGGFSLSTASGVQSAFASTGDVWTLQGSTTYFFRGMYNMTMSTNSVSVAMAFALGGGASVTGIFYKAESLTGSVNTTSQTMNRTFVDTVSSTVVTAANTANKQIEFTGILRMNAGGTVTPQINFSGTAAGSPTMAASSFITFFPIGTNTNNTLGAVA